MAEKKGKNKDGIWKVVKKLGARITSLEKQMKNMKGQFGKTTELEDDLQSLCYLLEALGDLGIFKIAEETDTTTGADLNRLIAAVKGVLPDIDVEVASDTDTTTGANLNSLIAALKGVLPDIDVEVASDTDTTTGANLNGLLVAIIKAVAAPICA